MTAEEWRARHMTQANRRTMNFVKDEEQQRGTPDRKSIRVILVQSNELLGKTTETMTHLVTALCGDPEQAESDPKPFGSMADEAEAIMEKCQELDRLAARAMNALCG